MSTERNVEKCKIILCPLEMGYLAMRDGRWAVTVKFEEGRLAEEPIRC